MKEIITSQNIGRLFLMIIFGIISLTDVSAANLLVTNTNDSGAGSLRDAVVTANSNGEIDTITFDPSIFNTPQTITLTSGEITIASDGTVPGQALSIIGPGRNLLTISGGNTSRIFLADLFSVVSISGMTLIDGNGVGVQPGLGGAVYLRSCDSAILSDLLITNNSAAAFGGGMAGGNVRMFRMTDSVVSSNSVNNAGGGLHLNFAALSTSDVKVSNIEVRNNTSTGSNTGAFISSNKLEISDSIFDSNTYNGAGGGLYGGLHVATPNGRIRDTSITNNSSVERGGGLHVDSTGNNGIILLERINVIGNVALEAGFGGGIFKSSASNLGKVVLFESLVSNNTSAPDSTPSGGNGAGIFSGSGPFDIINTTITGNTTSGTAFGNGGGIYNAGSTNMRIINSTIVGNTAEGANDSTDIWRGGGGISSDNGANTTIQNSIVAGNTATLGPDIRGINVSNGFNIIGDTRDSGDFGASGDQLNVDPLLDPNGLQDNGGATQTIALQSNSPAINNGSNTLAVNQNDNPLRFDQRGSCFNRFIGGTTDIGAFEVGATQLSGSNAPFDFDGDCKTDISIFRPNVGEWWYLRSSDLGNGALQFGSSTDIPTPADFTGDGKTDISFFRNGEWFVLRSEDSSFFSFPFGNATDIPAPGDFDGDSVADVAVFRPSQSTWFILRSSDNNVDIIPFGIAEDKPVIADYDGDGKDDIAIFRPSVSQWWINQSTDGVTALQFGSAGDRTVQGDYTGDGKADVSFFRPSTGEWFIIRSEDSSFFSFPFGTTNDIPAPGDYDGDGTFDATIFRPSNTTWFLNTTTNGVQIVGFGLNGDVPVPSVFSAE